MKATTKTPAAHAQRRQPAAIRWQAGFSLIELIIFIVIVGLLATALFAGFNQTLVGSATGSPISQAMRLAQERIELILPQRQQLGFAAFVDPGFDPCTSTPASTQAVCTTWPAGYTVTSSLQDNWLADTNYKIVVVDVSGPASTQIQALVANY